MSDTQTTVYLPNILLDESNYPSWFFRLDSFLKGQNLFGFVDGTIPCPPRFIDSDGTDVINPAFESWCIKDQSIINMIGQTLSSTATSCAVGSKTSCELWRNLRNKFAAPSRQNILQLKTNLQSLTKGADSIEVYLDKVKVARDALETVGVFLDDEDVVVTVLRGLPSEYNAIKGVIRAQAVSCSLGALKTLLKATEIDLEADSQSTTLPLTAMVAQANKIIQQASSSSPTSSTNLSVSAAQASALPASSSHVSTTSVAPASSQAPYVPIPALPYGFGPYAVVDTSSLGLSGFYAGQGRGHAGSFGNGGSRGPNSFGQRGANAPGHFNAGGFNNNGAGFNGGFGRPNSSGYGNGGGFGRSNNPTTCQLCGRVGHGARTCRTLSNFQAGQSSSSGIECQYCGRPNHTADRCFHIIGFPDQSQRNNGPSGSALLASTSGGTQYWLADSGATNHMTSEVQLLQNVTPFNATDTVQIGNGQGAGQGSVQGTE